jgi:hypothetical protein
MSSSRGVFDDVRGIHSGVREQNYVLAPRLPRMQTCEPGDPIHGLATRIFFPASGAFSIDPNIVGEDTGSDHFPSTSVVILYATSFRAGT